jgi:hypothetical protein
MTFTFIITIEDNRETTETEIEDITNALVETMGELGWYGKVQTVSTKSTSFCPTFEDDDRDDEGFLTEQYEYTRRLEDDPLWENEY